MRCHHRPMAEDSDAKEPDDTEAFIVAYRELCDRFGLTLVQMAPDMYMPEPLDDYERLHVLSRTEWDENERKGRRCQLCDRVELEMKRAWASRAGGLEELARLCAADAEARGWLPEIVAELDRALVELFYEDLIGPPAHRYLPDVVLQTDGSGVTAKLPHRCQPVRVRMRSQAADGAPRSFSADQEQLVGHHVHIRAVWVDEAWCLVERVYE